MLLVDDEPLIRRGLEATVPWEKHGIHVIGTAEDGADAIRKIKDHQDIDLVITDVRMPHVDGLELASFLYDNCPQVRIIMISGYDDFKYAQKAIQLGVQDYLLKPVDIDELLTVATKVTKQIRTERTESEQVHQTNLKNAIYHQVLDFNVQVPEELKLFEHVQIHPFLTMLTNYMHTTAQMSQDSLNELKREWEISIDNYLRYQGFSSISVFTGENMLLTCIVEYQDQGLSSQQVHSVLNKLVADQAMSLSFIFGKEAVQVKNLYREYRKLSERTKYLPFSTENNIVWGVQGLSPDRNLDYPDKIENELLDAIFQSKQMKITAAVEGLFNYLEAQRFFLDEAIAVCKEILTKVFERYQAIFRKEPAPVGLYFNRQLDVNLFNSYEILLELFQQDIDYIISQLDLKNAGDKDWLIERAENYIQSYYASELKAHEVADVINISPNYFSSLFKQRTGKNFNEYINQLRVDQAKTLLEETPFKVNEIANQVGYQEYKYFVEVFKKFTGVTPTKYRNLITSRS